MNFKHVNVEHLASLCLIKLTASEKELLEQNLVKILEYMNLLNEVDTTDISPCTNLLESMVNVMGEDIEGPMFDRNQFFENAPDQVGGMIKVPTVIQFEE